MSEVIDIRRDLDLLRFAETPKGQWFRCQLRSVMEYFDEDVEGFAAMIDAANAACKERGADTPWDIAQEMVARTHEIACNADEAS